MARPLSQLAGVAVAGLMALPVPALAADTYQIDPSHTSVAVMVDHMGFSTVTGFFQNVEGELVLDEENPAESSLEVTIPADSLDTGWDARDRHLRGGDFFDVENHPTITFTSTSVEPTGEKTAEVTGDLTMLGQTHPVTLQVTLNKIAPSPMDDSKTIAGFSAEGTLSRSQWGMDYGVPGISDEIRIRASAEAAR